VAPVADRPATFRSFSTRFWTGWRREAGQIFIDGTFGAGGYTQALLDAGASVVAIDRDPEAIAAGREMVQRHDGRLRLVEGNFSELDKVVDEAVDGVVLDVGVSSMQLDEAVRGFSFRTEGPLDMRMSGRGPTAADVVNSHKAGDLARIIGLLGEERKAGTYRAHDRAPPRRTSLPHNARPGPGGRGRAR
jgi:16S rRNA (cytosine1402-N4)-methyltransferase